MTVIAVYDANVLYPSLLRDLLIRVALLGGVRAKWSGQILDEVFSNIAQNRRDLPREKLDRTRVLMNEALRDADVEGYEHLLDRLELPDADDRHVLAVAIQAGAPVIVTYNIKDFPVDALTPYGISAQHPDQFLSDLFARDPFVVRNALGAISEASNRPALSVPDIVARLRVSHLSTLAACLTGGMEAAAR